MPSVITKSSCSCTRLLKSEDRWKVIFGNAGRRSDTLKAKAHPFCRVSYILAPRIADTDHIHKRLEKLIIGARAASIASTFGHRYANWNGGEPLEKEERSAVEINQITTRLDAMLTWLRRVFA